MVSRFNQMRFEVIRGRLAGWEDLFARAADLASRLGPDRVVSISHSEDANEGVVTVWYWRDPTTPQAKSGIAE